MAYPVLNDVSRMPRESAIGMLGSLVPPRHARVRNMPDISASLHLLDATFFLYPSYEDAEQGANYGGSGVIVGVPLDGRPDLHMRYAVTNWHVACRGSSVIRLNLPDGSVHILDKDPSEWTFLPGKQDLAATVLALPDHILPPFLPSAMFIMDDQVSDAHVGDDIFMVGRFIDYDGHETNRPATRFGTISMMDAPIAQPTGFRGRSIVVDMHSRTGFSGSPVYVYRPGGVTMFTGVDFSGSGMPPLLGPKPSYRKWGIGNDVQVRLLGVLWGQFPELWEINAGKKAAQEEASLITEGAFVRGFSGMSCIVPAIHVMELLNHPELKSPRDEIIRSGEADRFPLPQA